MFRVGDRVVYIGDSTTYKNRSATVTKVSEHSVWAQFDFDGFNGWSDEDKFQKIYDQHIDCAQVMSIIFGSENAV